MPDISTAATSRRVRDLAKAVLSPVRLQLAGKAALAAGLAWYVAPFMPGSAPEYAYYAPFGALISMYPTVAGSARQGLQSLIGLLIGIILAFGLTVFGHPMPWTVGVVIGIGVLLAGIPRLGAGRDWIPMAALFVLVIGGSDVVDFSFGYLLQTGVGVVIGLLVNLLIFPPLRLNAAAASLDQHRMALAGQLEDMGAALTETWPPDHEDWSRRSDRLAEAAHGVRQAVSDADLSRQINPRRRFHDRDVGADYDRVRALERVTFHVQDITEVLADAIWGTPELTPVPAELCTPLSGALRAAGSLLRTWYEVDADEALEEAEAALEDVSGRYHRLGSPQKPVGVAASVTMSLHRILRVVRATRPAAGASRVAEGTPGSSPQ
ncbi:FUSC family protein [Paenarthrobacter sp. PH39-S1]|uniref:FUSC family protein n=1 Tax=Micrococcaceae TaxID=1268 RepID=UPI0024BA2511|nr:FUSC family protein [Paenarthrobacter sp. PH39-S1]MDJ0354977.1 aromatic acid exporter family protein [Paenarthrobacter sp. PH39-S1]